jgi:hypothetical protein
MLNVGNSFTTLPTGMKPESKISSALGFVWERGVQGWAKEEAVTVWFFWRISKVTTSPTFAEMFEGLKVSCPPEPPTMTQ